MTEVTGFLRYCLWGFYGLSDYIVFRFSKTIDREVIGEPFWVFGFFFEEFLELGA